MTPGLAELLDKHVAVTFDKQLFLFELVGQRPYAFDAETGILTFAEDMKWQTQVLGTQSEISGTWLWSWANTERPVPERLLTSANELKQLGESKRILELIRPQFPVSKDLEGHDLAIIATGVTGARAYYRATFSGGALFLLINDPEFPPNIVDPGPRMAQTFIKTIKNHRCNHRRALLGYAEHFAMEVQTEGNRLAVLNSGDLVLTADFDDKGRLIQVQHKNPPPE